MRNILALVGAAVVAFLVVGWYMGWYQVSSTPSAQGPQAVQVDINPGKITEDVKKGVEKGGQIVDSLRDPPPSAPKAAEKTGPASNPSAPTPTPADGWRPITDDGPPKTRVPRN